MTKNLFKKLKFKSFLSNQDGMSLVEIMIVITIMSLVGLGTATLMKNMVSIQQRTELKNVASVLKSRMEEYIHSEDAWEQTVANHNPLRCTRATATPCNHNNDNPLAGAFLGSPSTANFNVYDNTGNIFSRGASASGGFTREGEPCNSFNATAGSGNNNCPFRYNVAAWFFCSNGDAQCDRPEVTVKAELVFNPRDKSKINARMNTNDYRITIKRQQKVRSESFRIVYQDPYPGINNADQIGGGDCSVANTAPQRYRPFTHEEYDEGNNVSLSECSGAGCRRFRIQPGIYDCKITTQSFEAIRGYKVILIDFTNARRWPAGGGYSGIGATAHSTQSVSFELTAPANFRLRHRCWESRNTLSGSSGGWDYGIPVRAYNANNPSIYTSVTCTRSS